MKCLILLAIIFKWILKITSLPKLYYQFFSKLGFIKSSHRLVMTDEHFENRLRVANTSIKVNLNRVVQKKSQLHISH